MKSSSLLSKLMAVAVGLFAMTSAHAGSASQHKGSFTIADPIQVNGKQIPAGNYDVAWEGEGPTVKVSISKGGKELASAIANVVTLEQKASDNAVEVKNSSG